MESQSPHSTLDLLSGYIFMRNFTFPVLPAFLFLIIRDLVSVVTVLAPLMPIDRLSHSIGINGAVTTVNTPTVFNTRFNFRLNWDGKFANFSDHLDALISNPQVMGIQWSEAIRSLQQVPEYVQLFVIAQPRQIKENRLFPTRF
jgi:cytochrome c peroxidase